MYKTPDFLTRGCLYIHKKSYGLPYPIVVKVVDITETLVRLGPYLITGVFKTTEDTMFKTTWCAYNTDFIEYDLFERVPEVLIDYFWRQSNIIIIDVRDDSLDILKKLLYTLYKGIKNLPLQSYNYVKITPKVENIDYYDVLPVNNKVPVVTSGDFLYYRSIYKLNYATTDNYWVVDSHLHNIPEEVSFKHSPIIIKDYCRRFFTPLKTEVDVKT